MTPDDFENLDYIDYIDLFPSIKEDTTFYKVVKMRSETDMEMVKKYTPEQYKEWLRWQKKKKEVEDYNEKLLKDIKEKNIKEREEKLKIAEQRLKELQEK